MDPLHGFGSTSPRNHPETRNGNSKKPRHRRPSWSSRAVEPRPAENQQTMTRSWKPLWILLKELSKWKKYQNMHQDTQNPWNLVTLMVFLGHLCIPKPGPWESLKSGYGPNLGCAKTKQNQQPQQIDSRKKQLFTFHHTCWLMTGSLQWFFRIPILWPG